MLINKNEKEIGKRFTKSKLAIKKAGILKSLLLLFTINSVSTSSCKPSRHFRGP